MRELSRVTFRLLEDLEVELKRNNITYQFVDFGWGKKEKQRSKKV